jgi:two-component sensor histidine kinase/ABC-type amino acid transport substrate-binding protein
MALSSASPLCAINSTSRNVLSSEYGIRMDAAMARAKLCLILALVALAFARESRAEGLAPRTIKLGYYDAKPSCFRDFSGKPSGIFIDVMDAAAQRNGWHIQYQFDSWDRLLEGLRSGSIDLVPAIVRTPLRETFAAFTQESVMTDWGTVFSRPGGGFSSIFQLDGRTVGALENDFWFSGKGSLADLCVSFGIHPKYRFYPDYSSLFRALGRGEVDAAAGSNSLGIVWAPRLPVIATSIVYNPIELRFASSLVAHGGRDLARELDRTLAEIRRDSPEVFSSALAKYQVPLRREVRIPPWLVAVLIAASLVLAIAAGLLVAQRRALHAGERRLQSIIEDSPIAIWEEDFSKVKKGIDEARAAGVSDWHAYFEPHERLLEFSSLIKVLDVNRATLELLGCERKEELLGDSPKGSPNGAPKGLPKILSEGGLETFRLELIALATGSHSFQGDTAHLNTRGEQIYVQYKLNILPGCEGTWSCVLVSTVDITERVSTEQALMSSLAEKEMLLQELHHRVKNNLQVICSLINLQRDEEGESSPMDRLFVDMEARIRAMSFVHEILYQSDNLASVEYSSYLNHLCTYLLDAYAIDPRRIRIVVSVADVRLPLDKAIPCGLLVNELVVNALKHAFKDGRSGTIEVKMACSEDGMVTLTVSDDGMGAQAPEGGEKKRKSIGLTLVTNLAIQLGGECKISSDKGFVAELSFPIRAMPGITRKTPW